MKTQFTEIILIILIQHKSSKLSSHKTATVFKEGPKSTFYYNYFCFLSYHLIFQLIIVLTEGNSSLVLILKFLIQLQSNCLFLM